MFQLKNSIVEISTYFNMYKFLKRSGKTVKTADENCVSSIPTLTVAHHMFF